MNYEDFKTYLASFLWKQNDTDLIANLDNLIKMGTSKLNRKLDINRREIDDLITIPVSSNKVALPADFRQMIALGDDQIGPYDVVTLQQLKKERIANVSNVNVGAYCLVNKEIFLGYTTSDTDTKDLEITYRSNLPDYKATDASWMEEDFLDVYTYTVLAQTAPFLREDDRLAMWITLSSDGINEILEEDKFNIEYGGSPLHQNTARPMPETNPRYRQYRR